jgi:hypothetical protein
MEHTHSQLIATPIVPLQVEQEIRRCAEYFDYRGRCLLCDMVMQEMQSGARMVMDTPNFIAFEPYAARFPFETHLMPKRHMSHFEATDDAMLPELARCLRTSISKIEAALNNPPYNYLIHTSPLNCPVARPLSLAFRDHPADHPRGRLRVGLGFYINTVPPEQAGLLPARSERVDEGRFHHVRSGSVFEDGRTWGCRRASCPTCSPSWESTSPSSRLSIRRRGSFLWSASDHVLRCRSGGGRMEWGGVQRKGRFYFIEHDNFFGREGLYGNGTGDYKDNLQRFVFLMRGALEYLSHTGQQPDIIHVHDWQTAWCRSTSRPSTPRVSEDEVRVHHPQPRVPGAVLEGTAAPDRHRWTTSISWTSNTSDTSTS